MIVPPVALAFAAAPSAERAAAVKTAIQVTRKSTSVLAYAYIYADMLIAVLEGASIPEAARAAASKVNLDIASEVRRSRGDPMTACYITGSFPAMLFFAFKYGDDVEAMLLASTNAGGGIDCDIDV